MEYMILIYQDTSRPAMPNDPALVAAAYAPWMAYTKALIDAGVMVAGSQLAAHSAATTVRMRDGKRHVQDGPCADTKEQLAGYYIIRTSDLDTALDWAAKCPGALNGTIEVRPQVG